MVRPLKKHFLMCFFPKESSLFKRCVSDVLCANWEMILCNFSIFNLTPSRSLVWNSDYKLDFRFRDFYISAKYNSIQNVKISKSKNLNLGWKIVLGWRPPLRSKPILFLHFALFQGSAVPIDEVVPYIGQIWGEISVDVSSTRLTVKKKDLKN